MTEREGKVVIVTGGGTGIGAAAVRRFAAEGARVAVVGRRHEPLERIADETSALVVVADAADSAQAADAVRRVIEEFGRVDVLVANAGGHGLSVVGETTDDDWELSLRTNVTTAFAMARAALPALIEAKGAIVIVSSLAGLFAGPGVAGYTVGKHALIGLTRSLARDYGKLGVRVNAVCPGWVRTPMADGEMDEFVATSSVPDRETAYARVTADVPLGRAAEPAEIASIIRFLASSDASYVTGAVLVADGGAHIVDVPTIAFDHP